MDASRHTLSFGDTTSPVKGNESFGDDMPDDSKDIEKSLDFNDDINLSGSVEEKEGYPDESIGSFGDIPKGGDSQFIDNVIQNKIKDKMTQMKGNNKRDLNMSE